MIAQFLSRLGRVHQGRIPFHVVAEEQLRRQWGCLSRGISRDRPTQRRLGHFASEMLTTLSRLGSGEVRYADFSELAASYEAAREALDEVVDLRASRSLLAIHDRYVTGLNARSLCSDVTRRDGCRQCGSCCIGPASGAISTSPLDLSSWQKWGRDDLLYYTLNGSREAPEQIQSLAFAACPFLRYPEPRRGLCLVHPVKPLICREFNCGSQASTDPFG